MTATRVALAVVLATALFGVATAGIDDGRTARTAAALDSAVTRVERAATHLRAHESATPPNVPGAHLTLAIRLPARSLAAADVAYLAFGGPPDGTGGGAVAVYRINENPPRTVPLPVRVAGERPFVLRDDGVHRVRVGLVRDGGVAVRLGRA